MNLSKNELTEIYYNLYFRNEKDRVVDYDKLVARYKVYLALFFEADSSIYGDAEFLDFVIDGFNFFYKKYFERENVDLDIVPLALCEYDTELRRKKEESDMLGSQVNYTDGDAVLVYTLKLAMTFKDMSLVDEFYEKIQRLFFNSYVVKREEEKGKECEKSGVEDRKCHN